MINPGGLINIVGTKPLVKKVKLDARRIHYDFVSLVGNSGKDLASSYGVKRNRSDLFHKGTVILYGAGGPIGQMHLQRAITSSKGPDNIIVVDVNQERLDYVKQRFGQIVIKNNKTLDLINPATCGENFAKQIKEIMGREVADDVIVMVPNPDVLEQAGSLLHKNSLLNIFAGTPSGTFFQIDISNIYLGNLQITGSSGLNFQHIRAAYDLARNGIININASVAAVGGMGVAQEAFRAVEERRVPGRVVIYPQLVDLPLMSIEELGNKFTAISPAIGEGNLWTNEAEKILMEIEER
jgi:threonine dehydrogenase-like Zn-dependent dehydrogenase